MTREPRGGWGFKAKIFNKFTRCTPVMKQLSVKFHRTSATTTDYTPAVFNLIRQWASSLHKSIINRSIFSGPNECITRNNLLSALSQPEYVYELLYSDLYRQDRVRLHVQFFISLILVSVVSIAWYMLVHYELLANPVGTESVIYRNPVSYVRLRQHFYAPLIFSRIAALKLKLTSIGGIFRAELRKAYDPQWTVTG